MANQERLPCEEHGGYFYRVPQRGRKPRNCTEASPCDAVKVPTGRKAKAPRDVAVRVVSEDPQEPPVRKPQARSQGNSSLDKGKAAKELLEAQSWTVTGKAWVQLWEGGQEGQDHWASVTAARGEEMLHIVWRNGEVQDQVYNLWNLDTPSKNGRPNAHLPFDPEEIPDNELARYLTGMKVTWWNKLAQKEETGVCGKEKITVEHIWTGTGDEFLGARIIKFVDPELGHYKAFRLDQLVKVG